MRTGDMPKVRGENGEGYVNGMCVGGDEENGVWLVWRMGRKRLPLDVLPHGSSRVAPLRLLARMARQEPYGTATDSNIFAADRSASKICLLDEGAVEASNDGSNNSSTHERARDCNA